MILRILCRSTKFSLTLIGGPRSICWAIDKKCHDRRSLVRALQQTTLNGPDDLRLITDAPIPSPGPGEVLIRVTAAGVNFVDISQAHGTFGGGPQPPYLAGIEAAGEVTAVGDGVTGLAPGAHVIGVGIAGGAFAEYMALP